jgi:membrane-associated protease RseP (regulator of RpoE activity)
LSPASSEVAFAHAPPPSGKPRRPFHLALFLLTFASVWFVGTVYWASYEAGSDQLTSASALAGHLGGGLAFALAVMGFLTAHEMGHYVACRLYRIEATLPFFLPLPLPLFPGVGTLGAVIRIRGAIRNKKQLLDIGIAGPLAGLAVALPVLVLGLSWSKPVVPDPNGSYIFMGEPLLMKLLERWLLHLGPNQDLLIHPLGHAAWFGLLATMFNLLPLGQLDGGHIAYAALGQRSRWLIRGTYFLCLVVGLLGVASWYIYHTEPRLFWPGWLLWAFIGRMIGLRHPPTLDDSVPIGRLRQNLAILALITFILCFIPVPIYLSAS